MSMPTPLTIHPMSPIDLPFAADCAAAEGWLGANLEIFEDFYTHDPAGCLLAIWDGNPAGICVATHYDTCGFIGELIVQPNFRQRGIGAALLNRAVQYLCQKGVQSIYLDGVPKAAPLYERNGFHKICLSLRFQGSLQGKARSDVFKMRESDLPAVFELDRQAFGADRSFFLTRRLKQHPRLCLVMMQRGELTGYLMGRQGDGWASAGPLITTNGADPIPLLERLAFELDNQPISLGVLACNQPAVSLYRGLGLEERPDPPWRMSTSPAEDLGASVNCWAIGSAAKG